MLSAILFFGLYNDHSKHQYSVFERMSNGSNVQKQKNLVPVSVYSYQHELVPVLEV